MKIGFDYGNTLTDPRLQAVAKSLSDHELYAISAVRPKNTAPTYEKIKDLGLPFKDIIVVPFDDWLVVPALKLSVCQQFGVELFIDDRLDTCAYLKMSGILTLYVM